MWDPFILMGIHFLYGLLRMNNNWRISFTKAIDRGLFYSLKIEIFKILFDQKYTRSRIRPIIFISTKILAKFTNFKQPKFILKCINKKNISFSQINQDFFVLDILNYKKNGFFILGVTTQL